MKRLLVTLALSAVAAAASLPAVAQDAPPPVPVVKGAPTVVPAPCVSSAMRLIHPRMLPTLESRLQLTPEQKGKVEGLLTKAEQENIQLVLAQRQAAQEFAETIASPTSTEAEITAKAKKAMDAETALICAQAKTLLELRSMLTPEQKKAFAEMMDQYTVMWRAQPGAKPAAGAKTRP